MDATMTRTPQKRRNDAGDPLSDLLDDTGMKSAAAKVRPRVAVTKPGMGSGVWWIAAAASLVWIMSVAAFAWSRYALPSDPGSVLAAAQSRIGASDWMMIAAAMLGPLLLIWTIAWLIHRSMELRDESRRLAKAAVLLADAAEAVERRAEKMLPATMKPGGVVAAASSGTLDREIKRAASAMTSLQVRMNAMEAALTRQTAAMDSVTERAQARSGMMASAVLPRRPAKALTMRDDTAPQTAAGPVGADEAVAPFAVASSDEDDSGLVVTATAPPSTADSVSEAAVDLALDDKPLSRVESLRAGLLAAGRDAAWAKLVPDAQAAPPLGAPASQAAKAATTDRIDPFDDLAPLAAGAGAASAAPAAALGVGVTNDDFDATLADARLDAPYSNAPPAGTGARGSAASDANQPPKTMQPEADLDFLSAPLDWRKFVRAANFPESERDTETLDALYDVLTDKEAAALLQSAEDTLATLSDLDLYMEDFVPEMSPVTAWRAHLDAGGDGERIKGIDAPIERSRIDAKLESDPAFRKMCERFVERYQAMLRRLFKDAREDRLALDLADTRTGRAYLLVADALGTL